VTGLKKIYFGFILGLTMNMACPPIGTNEDEQETNKVLGGLSVQLMHDFLDIIRAKPVAPRDFLTALKILASMESSRRQLIRQFLANLDTAMIIGPGLYCARGPDCKCLLETDDEASCAPGKCPHAQEFEADLLQLAVSAEDPITAVGMHYLEQQPRP
jgi:hypothetical protein